MEHSTTDICKLVSATEGVENGCVLSELEPPARLCLSPIWSDPELFNEVNQRRGVSSFDHALLAESSVVSDTPSTDHRHSPIVETQPQPAVIATGGVPPANAERLDEINRLETLRNCLGAQGLPPEVVKLLLAATRDNTHAAYQSAWSAWRDWCHRGDNDPLSVGVIEVLKFLTDSFLEGKSYSSINIFRSMLSSTLSLAPSGLSEVGKHPLVTTLLKGMYNARPPLPKYTNTWDPTIVLNHLDATAARELSTLSLARKLATLIAITTLLRCGEIASIKADSIAFSQSEASFTLGKPRKSQHSGALKRISVAAWHPNEVICPVTCLKAYLTKTKEWRTPSNAGHLFIGSTRPHNPVSSSTISRWIKDQLREAGVDTSVYSAHSTRSAAASKAAASGISISSILSKGSWASESTFAKFYHRETRQPDPFGSAILGDQDSSSD